MRITGIILAAGKGTRMKSELPKGLHRVCGIPMAALVGRAMMGAGIEKPIVVVGHGGDLMMQALGPAYDYAWQHEQHGTGHAAMMAVDAVRVSGADTVVIAPGDTPLISEEALTKLLKAHQASGAQGTVASAILSDATGYGRIIRDADGPTKIVEHKDATDAERAVSEVNAAIYVFDVATLLEILPTLSNDNQQGEYYLTDVIAKIRSRGGKVEGVIFDDHDIMRGVNDRWQLAEAAKVLRERVLKKHALNGVTIVDPDSTYIEPDVEIGEDTTIEPSTTLEGNTRIGRSCQIGPNTKVQDSSIGDGCVVLMSHVNGATLLGGARCGPFANLRPGSVLGEQVKIGNFVEVKNATLGARVAVSHLSYIGDGEIGPETNVGAGTIFCNYDGFLKHRTVVGARVFVGSNSTLVAPVRIGDGAMIAAGSVITSDVPGDALALGRARQEVKDGWVVAWRHRQQAEKERRKS